MPCSPSSAIKSPPGIDVNRWHDCIVDRPNFQKSLNQLKLIVLTNRFQTIRYSRKAIVPTAILQRVPHLVSMWGNDQDDRSFV